MSTQAGFGALLVRFGPQEVADAFCASRLGTSYDGTYGTLTTSTSDLRSIVQRATPEPARSA